MALLFGILHVRNFPRALLSAILYGSLFIYTRNIWYPVILHAGHNLAATSAVANMRVGWNLGNTLDSNSGDINNMWIEKWTSRRPSHYETAWRQPITRPQPFQMFKQAGFNAIRVPVTWYPHMQAHFTLNGTAWDPENDHIGTKILFPSRNKG